MKVFFKTRKSHYWNEDRYIIGKNFFMVIDGATPLMKSNNFNEACWMVNYIKKNVNKYSGKIKNRLFKLSEKAYEDYPLENKEKIHLPSASISWVEIENEYIYASILGDCEVTFVTNDNHIIRCYTDELNQLDEISIQELKKIAKEKNIHNLEARPYIHDTLIKHRNLINEYNGCSAFTLSNTPIINEKSFRIEKESVKEIYLYSDGFSQAFEHLGIYDNHQSMFSKTLNLNEEIEKIVTASFADPYCDKYPRLKKIDDITVIKIEMNSSS